jgi:hypothetical protein
VTANGVRVKGDEDDVVEFQGNKLEVSIGSAPTNWFVVNQNSVFNDDVGLPKRGRIIKIDRIELCRVDFERIEDQVPDCTQFCIIGICLYPLFARG